MNISNAFLLSFVLFCRTELANTDQRISIINPHQDKFHEKEHKSNGVIIEEVNDEGEIINPENSNRYKFQAKTDFKTETEKNDFFNQSLNDIIDRSSDNYDKKMMKNLIYSFKIICEMSDDQIRRIGIGELPNWFNGKVKVKNFISRKQADKLQEYFDGNTKCFRTKNGIILWINLMIDTNDKAFFNYLNSNEKIQVWDDFFKIIERNEDVLNDLLKSKEKDIPADIRKELIAKDIKTNENGRSISSLELIFVSLIGYWIDHSNI